MRAGAEHSCLIDAEAIGLRYFLPKGLDKTVDYKAALNYILGFTNYEKSLKELYAPGKIDLERVRELLKRIGSPHEGPGIVHIAGT